MVSNPARRIALVTGSSGIAAATVRRLASAGWALCVVGIEADQVRELTTELTDQGHSAVGSVADLRSTEECDAAFAVCHERLGAPNAVVAVAGGSGRRFGDGAIAEMSAAAWNDTFALNALPVMTTARAAVNAMRQTGGSIVIVSSVLALSPAPPRFETHAYAAAKGAALSLVTTMAASYASAGIRVNAVLPGATDTPMSARAAIDDEIQSFLTRKQPLSKGMVSADDVAAAIAFLVSDDAGAITGQVIAVDGGWSVTQAT